MLRNVHDSFHQVNHVFCAVVLVTRKIIFTNLNRLFKIYSSIHTRPVDAFACSNKIVRKFEPSESKQPGCIARIYTLCTIQNCE